MIDVRSLMFAILEICERDSELCARLGRVFSTSAADDIVAAQDSGLSPREFRAAIRRGELAGSKVGRRYVSTRAALSDYLARRRVEPKPYPERRREKPKPLDCSQVSTEAERDAEQAIQRALKNGSLRLVGSNRR
jgi:hypothetical protein